MTEKKLPQPLSTVTFVKKSSKRGRGRPRKIKLLPKSQEVMAIQKKKEEALEDDNLSTMLQENPNSLDVLDYLMLALAKEAASLHFERTEAERKGHDTSTLSSRKVTALKSVADIYFRKRESVIDQAFDFKSKRFQAFVEWLLIKVIRKSAENAGFTTEQISILFSEVAKRFDDPKWDKEALEFIKKAE